MKYINTIINFIFFSIFIVFLYMFFPSVNSYINNFSKRIDVSKDLLVDRIGNSDTIKSIGDLVKDTVSIKDYGYTGEEYDFDSLYYPYYSNLNSNEKLLYKQIYANCIYLVKSFTPIVDIEINDITFVVESVMYDHPELFFLDNQYSYKYNNNGRCIELNLSFNSLADSYVYNKEIFEYNVSLIVDEANKYNSVIEKEKYVHDKLVETLSYDNKSMNNQSAYSAIVNKSSVCAGYSKAFQYIMQKLGIPCYYVTGYSNGAHAWNIVKIDGYYYNVDLTWDNTGSNMYSYFNKNDDDFNYTHTRSDISNNLPQCLGESFKNTSRIDDIFKNIESYIIDFKVN